MRRRYIQLITGAALIIIGAVAWFRPNPNGVFLPVALGVAGIACFVRYRAKHETWSLVGLVLFFNMAVGGVLADKPAFLGCFTASFTASLFLTLPGGVALVLGFERRRNAVIIPAALAIWLGSFVFARDLRIFNRNAISLFCGCLACAGLTVWAASRGRYGWKPVAAAAAFIGAALVLSDGFRYAPFVTQYLPGLLSLITVASGVALIFITLRRR